MLLNHKSEDSRHRQRELHGNDLSEIRTWILQQCNVYGSCTLRERRFKQEFAQEGMNEDLEIIDFCSTHQLTVTFIADKAHYLFQKSTE